MTTTAITTATTYELNDRARMLLEHFQTMLNEGHALKQDTMSVTVQQIPSAILESTDGEIHDAFMWGVIAGILFADNDASWATRL